MKIITKLEKLELHHRIIAFIVIMILTIAITRLSVLVHNPNPLFFNFEIHHFDYGIFLLLITNLLLLFGKPNLPVHLFTAGIAFGLIIDDLWFIRSNINDPGINEVQIYNSTFLSVLILSIFIVLLVLLIDHFKKKKKHGLHTSAEASDPEFKGVTTE